MEEIFAKFIKTHEITFKYAKGMRDIIGKEIHTYHEIFLFLSGDAEFISDLGSVKLDPNTLVIIPKQTFHQFVVTGPESEYRRCVFNFEFVSQLDTIIDKKFQKISILNNKEINAIFYRLQNFCDNSLSKDESDILLKALFAQILVHIHSDTEYDSRYSDFSDTTRKALDYINRNLNKALTVKHLSEKFHISPSNLEHTFKNDIKIPIHRYILQKRLILANSKITEGKTPTEAAHDCGFNDYSGFYKQYKKMFGTPPSKRKTLQKSQ